MVCLGCEVGASPATAAVSRFEGASGVAEYHLVVRPTEYGSVEEQLVWVERAYRAAVNELGLNGGTAVFRRFFCSDLPNQSSVLEAAPFSNFRNPDEPCAISWVRQPSVPPAKVTLWAYHISDPARALNKTLADGSLTIRRGDIGHHWTTNLTCLDVETSYDQTRKIFEQYEHFLHNGQMTLADNVIRTWLFVQNIDANYQGMVVARRELFAQRGLTAETHYIASSGIEGTHADVKAKVAMDAWAISGLQSGQVQFMRALDHLSPTHRYGVTFERGTTIAWRDRKHLVISGTASIDHEGNILHPGNVSRQLDRTLENVETLLKNSGARLSDMSVWLVYLRDPSDYFMAQQRMREQFGETPIEVLVAPVCRPGWLIELEGIATIREHNPTLPEF